MLEHYLVLDPDGSFRWIDTDRTHMAASFRNAINCDWLENVTLPYGFNCIVDEVGKVRQMPKPVNPFASLFYPGTMYGDPLVGSVIFVRIGLVDGESDFVPLTTRDIRVIELITGLEVPQLQSDSEVLVDV